MLETSVEVTCPYCGEDTTLFIDLSVESQSYIEDCTVCCRPMSVTYSAAGGELLDVQVSSDD